MNIDLYVITHKEVANIPSDRQIIGVGGKELKCTSFYDNTGENISDKNGSFCELTALFWMWKNSNADILGLEHYRRIFCRKNPFVARPIDKQFICKKLLKFDVIIAEKFPLYQTVYKNYSRIHSSEDLVVCKKIIEEKYPEYVEDFEKLMRKKKISPYNMFVMPKHLVDEYCTWLFDILFEAEKIIDLSDKDDYQKRIFGFLAERLFNLWLMHKKLKIYYSQINNIGDMPVLIKLRTFFNRLSKFFKLIFKRKHFKP